MPARKKPIERVRKRVLSIRCSAPEYQQLEDAAAKADVPLSDWVRDAILRASSVRLVAGAAGPVTEYRVGGPIPELPPEFVARIAGRIEDKLSSLHEQFAKDHPLSVEFPLTWADHWAQMERMEPGEATEKLLDLAAGRKFPDGFPRWPKARKIEWLDKEWKL